MKEVIDEMIMVPQSSTLEERVQQTAEKAIFSKSLNVMKSGSKEPATTRRMLWADEVENVQVTKTSSVITIDTDDIHEEVEYWSSTIICYVLGANPPLNVMDGYFRRIWGKLGIDKIRMVGGGIFLVRIDNVEASLKVTNEGMQFFDQKPLITGIWDPDMPMEKTKVETVPIWIKLPGLAIKYWGGGEESF